MRAMRADDFAGGAQELVASRTLTGILLRGGRDRIQRRPVGCIITAGLAGPLLIPTADGIDPGSELSSGATTWVTQDKW